MEIWLDTAEIAEIKKAYRMGLLYGVTTNPSILASSKRISEDVIKEILDVQPGPVAVQVTTNTVAEMLLQAKKLTKFSSRIVVKVPAVPQGYEAMKAMDQENIPVMATAILHAAQVILAGINRAAYAAPYLGKMFSEKINYRTEIKKILQILHVQQMPTKLIAAAIKDRKQFILCAELGVPAITVPSAIFTNLIDPLPTTHQSLAKFALDWENSHKESKLFLLDD